MARTGFRKVANVHGSLQKAWPVHVLIRSFLEQHHIGYKIQLCTDPFTGREVRRYMVHLSDLEKAREVLPVVKELQERINA